MKLSSKCAMLLVLCAVCSGSLPGQAPTAPAFEVASVKPLPPIETLAQEIASGKLSFTMMRGAVLSGARFEGMASLLELIMRAYNVQPYRIAGPEWMRSQLFEIHAKMPEGSSKDEVPQMLQKLLAERFKLVTHWEKREQPVYALVVSKDGHKLKEAVQTAEAPRPSENTEKSPPPKTTDGENRERTIASPFGSIKMKPEKDGGTSLSTEKSGAVRWGVNESGLMVMEFSKINMRELAERLTNYLDRPVVDQTDLNGAYQVALEISKQEQMNTLGKPMPPLQVFGTSTGPSGVPPGSGLAGVAASDPSGGGVFRSVQKMGLKLDPRKAPVDMLVIDRIEKVPTSD